MDAAAWGARADASVVVAADERVTLGFDGSRNDDSTALVGCRGQDGHLFLIGCWQKPPGPEGKDWQVDRMAVKAAVAEAMESYDVVGFYCDPAHWQDTIDTWTTAYGARMRVKATKPNPLEWWTNRPTAIVAALKRLHDAVMAAEMTHDGSKVLTAARAERAPEDGRPGRDRDPQGVPEVAAEDRRGDGGDVGVRVPRRRREGSGWRSRSRKRTAQRVLRGGCCCGGSL
jgi:hypothetical protein